MNRRQKIIVSVTGIFLVLLLLVGLTYAYFLTRITGNTNDKSISVSTANLALVYGDGNGIITASGIQPGVTLESKTFSVTNNGNSTVSDYQIYLENVVNQLSRKDDLVYTLICESNDKTKSPCTNQITEEKTFPSTNGTILTNSIAVGDTHTYTLTLKYKEMGIDQSEDMNKKISAKVNLYDKNEINKLTLTNYIINDNRIVKNETAPTFTGVATEELGMYSAEDDYGTSWYFRGAQPYNYVNFAGFTWRIVRINGDSTVRLILDGTLDKVTKVGEIDPVYKNTNLKAIDSDGRVLFNTSRNDNAYIGYMYGFTGGVTNKCITKEATTGKHTIDSSTIYTTKEACEGAGGRWAATEYETTHINKNSSTIKIYIDKFYEEYLLDYESNIADTLFCADKSLADSTVGNSNTTSGYGNNTTFYATSGRLYYSAGLTSITTATPTLECAKDATNTYSRYTSKSKVTTKEVSVNNDLTYPIALLSADELVMAGAWRNSSNKFYYLYDASTTYSKSMLYNYWFTMSPISSQGADLLNFLSNTTSYSLVDYNRSNGVNFANGIRPVINLNADSLIVSGDGTIDAPYEIKIS